MDYMIKLCKWLNIDFESSMTKSTVLGSLGMEIRHQTRKLVVSINQKVIKLIKIISVLMKFSLLKLSLIYL